MNETVDMGNLACGMIDKTMQAIVDGDERWPKGSSTTSVRINHYDHEVEDAAIKILTIYQLTAGDIKTVATILKSITYLERIRKYRYNSRRHQVPQRQADV